MIQTSKLVVVKASMDELKIRIKDEQTRYVSAIETT